MLTAKRTVAYLFLSLLLVSNFSCQNSKPYSKTLGSIETKLIRGGRIWSLDWSPDDKYIACGNASGLLRIYDAKSLELVNILTGFKYTINGIHWSPDGTKIVASGPHEDPRIILWNLEDKSRTIIDSHKRQVRSVKWSPKGTYFASSSHDGTIRIWTPEGKFVKMFKGANGGCVGIDWLDEDKLAASCWDNTIRTYTISGSDSLLIENGNHRNKAVLSIDWHPNGELLATGDYGNEGDTIHAVKIWTIDGQLKAEMHSHEKEIRSLAWNREGNLLATGGETIRLWNKEGMLLKVFKDNSSPVWSLDWNTDGNKIVSGHDDGKIRMWDMDGKLLNLLDGHSSETSAVSFSKDSTQVFIGFSDGTLRSFSLDNMTSASATAHSGPITNILLSHDQKHVAVSSYDGTSSIWSIENGKLSNDAVHFGEDLYTESIAWNPDDRLVAYLQDERTVSVFSAKGELQYSTKLEGNDINALGWKEGKPIGINSEKKPFEFDKKIMVRKEDKYLELIPLNNNRFALVDSLNGIIHGDKTDFIRLFKDGKGFVSIKSIE